MITIQNENVDGIIKLPTSIEEITPKMLADLTANVTLQKHYVIIALCWKVGLTEILLNSKKNGESKVISLIAKTNVNEDYSWIIPGKIAIINRSSIELATHLHVPTAATIGSINNHYTQVAKLIDPRATGPNAMILREAPTDKFYLIEFKIIPASDIKAIVDSNIDVVDPFIG